MPPAPAGEREREHAAVGDLADELVPALIARLSATGLAELEVRQGRWKIRLRRPLEITGGGRRASDRQLRLQGAGYATAGGGVGSRLPAVGGSAGATAPAGQGPDARPADGRPVDEPGPPVASAPAVGIFRPGSDVVGRRVRAGDRLGAVDMLGVLQEVVSPVDGIAGRLLAQAGDGVEYGQPLLEILAVGATGGSGDGSRDPAADAGQGAAGAGESR